MKPPPLTLIEMSTLSLISSPMISNGARITSLEDSGSIISSGILLILIFPTPFVMNTCALDVFLDA